MLAAVNRRKKVVRTRSCQRAPWHRQAHSMLNPGWMTLILTPVIFRWETYRPALHPFLHGLLAIHLSQLQKVP